MYYKVDLFASNLKNRDVDTPHIDIKIEIIFL